MIKNIKSIYFLDFVFTYLKEKVKLNITKYNKILQKSINMKLINYKLVSGKYILKESNVMWNIYDASKDILLFEGNYLNGNGKQYFFDGKLLSEGGYLNGKKMENLENIIIAEI